MPTIFISNRFGEIITPNSKGYSIFFTNLKQLGNLVNGIPEMNTYSNFSDSILLIIEPKKSGILDDYLLTFVHKGGTIFYAYGMAGDPDIILSTKIGRITAKNLISTPSNYIDLNFFKSDGSNFSKVTIKKSYIGPIYELSLNHNIDSVPLIKENNRILSSSIKLDPKGGGNLILLSTLQLLSNTVLSRYKEAREWMDQVLFPLLVKKKTSEYIEKAFRRKFSKKVTTEKGKKTRFSKKTAKKTSEDLSKENNCESILSQIVVVSSTTELKSKYRINKDKLLITGNVLLNPNYDCDTIYELMGDDCYAQIMISRIEDAVPKGFKIDSAYQTYDTSKNMLYWDDSWASLKILDPCDPGSRSCVIEYAVNPVSITNAREFNPVIVIELVRNGRTIASKGFKLFNRSALISVI